MMLSYSIIRSKFKQSTKPGNKASANKSHSQQVAQVSEAERATNDIGWRETSATNKQAHQTQHQECSSSAIKLDRVNLRLASQSTERSQSNIMPSGNLSGKLKTAASHLEVNHMTPRWLAGRSQDSTRSNGQKSGEQLISLMVHLRQSIALLAFILCLSLGNNSPNGGQPKEVMPSINLLSPTRGMIFAAAQYKPEWPSKTVEQEIFLLNLEDGYFGCQVNESQDFLQLFELSKLCDGRTQCFMGTDELSAPLKCNNRDRCGSTLNSRGQLETIKCVNGVCLDGLCYCNDGFGGKSCDVQDENECKYRPCDVFAHCTNTMGSYYCSCFPGEYPVRLEPEL